MEAGICKPDEIDDLVKNGYSVGTEVHYFYQPCVGSDNDAALTVRNCVACYRDYSNRTLSCAQFCDKFESVLPWVYFTVSLVSMICCLGVFVTYCSFPRLRRSGYSSKVFLYRTLVDLVIALGHIVTLIFHLSKAETKGTLAGCRALGVINEVALVASNLWYVMLAMDLIKAIRNPFSSQPSYKPLSHLIVWGFSALCGTVLVVLTIANIPGEAGPSMFYWCWVSVGTVINKRTERKQQVLSFATVSLFLYYFWHFAFWVFSLCVLIAAAWILRGHLSASSQTRKFVLKQNFYYVLVLGIETAVILPIWIAQLALTKHRVAARGHGSYNTYYPYYFTYTDLVLAIIFAVMHSLRGTIDFFIWLGTFTIGYRDIKFLRYRLRKRFTKKANRLLDTTQMSSPVIVKRDSAVNSSLRRNAMYCINIGILDAVALQFEHSQVVRSVSKGPDDDSYFNASLMQFDEEQDKGTTESQKKQVGGEQSLRSIQFPPSTLLGITCFSFIDLEPSIFNMLRSSYGIDTRTYRASFKIKNAADIESSGMLEKFTEGKSGSFFYFTRDFKYIIKTVTDEEEKFLQKIAYRYYDHMKNNPNSLIVRFFGLHKVRLAREQRFITVVVMENIFHNTDQFKMHERYDLKGSRVGRRSVKKTSKMRREYKGTLKDLDLGGKKIHVGADSKAQIVGQLRRDVEFLIQCKIMDYSLLLGIHNHSRSSAAHRTTVREGSIRGKGDDFVDVDIANGSGLHRTATGSSSIKSFRDRLSSHKSSGYNTRSSTTDSSSEATKPLVVDEDGDIVESQFHNRQEHIAWFREDFGGLRSISPLHPLYEQELQLRGPSVYFDQEQQSDKDVPAATYYFGIVDILQQYNWRKKVEHQWKTKFACQDKHGISCVNEREYGERFLNFMDEIFQ